MSRIRAIATVAFLLGLALQLELQAQQQPGTTDPLEQSGDAAGKAGGIEKRSRLQGHAYAGRHEDIVGAVVRANEMGDPTRIYLTSTDARGIFRIDGLSDGQYQLGVARAGYTPMTKEGIAVRFPFRAVVELLMSRDGSEQARTAGSPASNGVAAGTVRLRGRVRDAKLDGVHETRIRLVRVDGAVDPRSRESRVDGSFDFEGLPAGVWSLSVQGIGSLPIRTPIDLTADTELTITLIDQPASYEPSPFELMPPETPVPPPAFVAPGPREASLASGAARSGP